MKSEILNTWIFPADYYTKEENCSLFIKLLRNSILTACKTFENIHRPLCVVKATEYFLSSYDNMLNKTKEIAKVKYKTEKKQQEYINNQMMNYSIERASYIANGGNFHPIDFFDFDVNPGINGISNDCILNVYNLTNDKLRKCWERIKDNEYFKVAEGIKFEYNGTGRPQILLILSKDYQKKFDEDRNGISTQISDLYSNTHYCGD